MESEEWRVKSEEWRVEREQPECDGPVRNAAPPLRIEERFSIGIYLF